MDDALQAYFADPLPITRALLPRVPLALRIIFAHSLGTSEVCPEWSLRLELTARIIRSFFYGPLPSVVDMQMLTLKGFPVSRKMWIGNVVIPPWNVEEGGVEERLYEAIDALKGPGAKDGGYEKVGAVDVEAEWTGYCTSRRSKTGMSERDKFRGIMKDIKARNDGRAVIPTILYFHGGGAVLMDPSTHRPTVVQLCRYANARALSIRYRLAPRYPFPAALLDALQAYLYLLYPPATAFHAPIPASSIVFAGDSSGGTLCFSLSQLLLYFQRNNVFPAINGRTRSIPLPAGLATPSPWLDITRSLPSWRSNAPYDYLPSPASHPDGMYYPPCGIWPSLPARKNFIAEEKMLAHPLVSPIMAEDWSGMPPMWVCVGEREMMRDEVRFVLDRVVAQGVNVRFEQWQGMVHCFFMLLAGGREAEICLKAWAGFVRDALDEAVVTQGVMVKAKTKGLRREKCVMGDLCRIPEKEVRELVSRRTRAA